MKQLTFDSWYNPTTGVGGPADKTSGFTFGMGGWRQWDVSAVLDDLYRSDELAAIKVDAVVDDSFHKGWSVESSLTAEENEAVIDFNDQLGIQPAIIDARKWSRLFGGAAVFVGSDDGVSQEMPLQLGGRIAFAEPYERDELQPSRYYSDPLSPKFGQPSHYRLSPFTAGGVARSVQTDVHESRFIIFHGVRGTKRQRADSLGWGQSVLLRPMTALKQFNGAYALVLSLLADANQNIYKLKDFAEMLRSGQAGEAAKKRLEIIDRFRSSVNAIIVDAETEDFVRSQLSLSGVESVLTSYKERLAAAFEMPLTRLLGVSPAGLNATGESDLRNWHKQVESERKTVLKPALERWLNIIFAAKNGPTGGIVPDSFSVKFPSLWDLSPKEEAEVDSINANTDKTYREMGVLRKEHIASRFTGDRLRPSLSKEDIEALKQAEQPEVAPTGELGSPLDGEADSIDSDDEPDVDNDLMTFIAQMNEHRVERCPHGKVNRCRMCGIERVRELSMDPSGAPVLDAAGSAVCNVKWRPVNAA